MNKKTSELKKGDKVRRINNSSGGMNVGDTGTVVDPTGIRVKNDRDGEESGGHSRENLELIGRKAVKVNFLLTWERNHVDPNEEFTTIEEVREAVKKLMDDEYVDQTSYKVYKVTQVMNVKVSKSIVIK